MVHLERSVISLLITPVRWLARATIKRHVVPNSRQITRKQRDQIWHEFLMASCYRILFVDVEINISSYVLTLSRDPIRRLLPTRPRKKRGRGKRDTERDWKKEKTPSQYHKPAQTEIHDRTLANTRVGARYKVTRNVQSRATTRSRAERPSTTDGVTAGK